VRRTRHQLDGRRRDDFETGHDNGTERIVRLVAAVAVIAERGVASVE